MPKIVPGKAFHITPSRKRSSLADKFDHLGFPRGGTLSENAPPASRN
jgi:hypothetical protein